MWLKDMARQPQQQQGVGLGGMRLCWLRGKLRENEKFCLSHSGLDLSHVRDRISHRLGFRLEQAGRSGSMSRNVVFELLSAWEIIQKYKM